MSRQSGKDVLEVKDLCKAFGEKKVLENVSFTVRRAERVAIIGANGLGKSTMLKICAGHLQADRGSAAWGHETRAGYFAQDHRELMKHPTQSTLDFLWDFVPEETTNHVRGVLGRMLFSREEVDKQVGHLSGGEAARLIFSQLMVQKPNVLLLDEPTNHLDLESIEALVGALEKYEGTLIFVSHDRWFVEKLATRIVEIRVGGLNEFNGGYDAYLAKQGDDHLSFGESKRAKKAPSLRPNS
jgi:ATPase subunit of ABC transporter with duplicated ATPase domains